MPVSTKVRFQLRPLKMALPDDVVITEIPVATEDGITIALTRFQRGSANRSILLLHGNTLSTDMFVMPEHRNLVSVLLDEGWSDVWSLDWRGSCRLPYHTSGMFNTVDDVALYDIPAAIQTIRDQTNNCPLYVISHCIGSMALAIALTSGIVTGLHGVVANSVFLSVMLPGKAVVKIASPIPEIIHRLYGLNYIPADFKEVGLRSTKSLLFAMASATRTQCSDPTCHMISFLCGTAESPLFHHHHLLPETHSRLSELVGPSSLSYYYHYRKIALAQTSVRFNDNDQAYEKISPNGIETAGCIDCPILLLNGSDNLFWGDSNKICYQILREHYPHLEVSYTEVPGYGHLDPFIGRYVAIDVFPHILNWLNTLILSKT